MKNILQILYSGLGGHGSVFFSLVEADVKKEFRHSAIFYGIEPLLEDYALKCNQLNIPYVYEKKRQGLDLDTQRSFLSWMEEQRPDAIILHSPPMLYLCRKYRKKFPKTRLLLVEHNSNSLKGSKGWILSSLAFPFVDHVVYLTESYKKEVQKKIGIFFKSHKAAVIANGINTSRFCPKELPSSRVVNIGMCGRMNSHKDFGGLIDAFETLIKRQLNFRLKLDLAGDGPDRSRLEDYVQSIGLQKDVTFRGLLGEAELVSFYQGLNIYAHSTFAETMSTSVMQALASGIPTIASSVSGMQLVLPSSIGVHVEPGNSTAMCNAIEALLSNRQKQEQMAMQSRSYAMENLSNITSWKQYLQLLFP